MKTRFWLLRATLEAKSPLAIGTGAGDDLHDALFAAGAGGLPYLPATSLVGVLRRRCQDLGRDAPWIARVFGTVAGTAAAARLVVSHGLVHGANDVPRAIDADPGDDLVLQHCARGVTRDHVRRDGFGVVDGRGKFDDDAVPVGARFAVSLRLDSRNDQEAKDAADIVATVLAALHDLSLGGKTRRAFGRMEVVRAWARHFDLRGDAKDVDTWTRVERDLTAPAATQPEELKKLGFGDVVGTVRAGGGKDAVRHLRLRLQAEDHWLVSGGSAIDGVAAHKNAKGRDRHGLPWSECVVCWDKGGDGRNKGRVSERPVPVLPGTSIKGALRHRTLFHYRRLCGQFAPSMPGAAADAAPIAIEAAETALAPLFGTVKGTAGASAGRVRVADVVLRDEAWQSSGAFDHVSIDRFTGGQLSGLLYSEATLYRTALRIDIAVDPAPTPPEAAGRDEAGALARAEAIAQEQTLRRALAFAIADLAAGRLPIGAKANAGHGALQPAPGAEAEVQGALQALWNDASGAAA